MKGKARLPPNLYSLPRANLVRPRVQQPYKPLPRLKLELGTLASYVALSKAQSCQCDN
jgi:hypothetical protein